MYVVDMGASFVRALIHVYMYMALRSSPSVVAFPCVRSHILFAHTHPRKFRWRTMTRRTSRSSRSRGSKSSSKSPRPRESTKSSRGRSKSRNNRHCQRRRNPRKASSRASTSGVSSAGFWGSTTLWRPKTTGSTSPRSCTTCRSSRCVHIFMYSFLCFCGVGKGNGVCV